MKIDSMDKYEFKLDCAFLHKKLVIQLLSPTAKQITEKRIADIMSSHLKSMSDTFINSVLTDAVLTILKANKVKSLDEKLLRKENLKIGELIWMEQDFYFKGSVKASGNYKNGVYPARATFYTLLKRFDDLKLNGEFNAEHLFGDTAVSTLSGKRTVFILAFVEEVNKSDIKLRPIFIGRKMIAGNSGFELNTDHLRVSIEEIDQFKKVESVPHSSIKIADNKNYSENSIKRWFAEIIFENNVPKDWGGEKSDLFTNHIYVNGKRCNAAFLFKGPAKFEPMTIKNLGKNGDQISRLYDEPAEVYILQHCHYVKAEIYKTMKAFSANFTNITRFCVIDGEDTLRILKAYNKI